MISFLVYYHNSILRIFGIFLSSVILQSPQIYVVESGHTSFFFFLFTYMLVAMEFSLLSANFTCFQCDCLKSEERVSLFQGIPFLINKRSKTCLCLYLNSTLFLLYCFQIKSLFKVSNICLYTFLTS